MTTQLATDSVERSAGATNKWVYEFAEGSREMRDLLGGKGAGVAEMTRILGADMVPAGFTITTEACVAYMNAGQDEPDGMAGQVADVLAMGTSLLVSVSGLVFLLVTRATRHTGGEAR